MRKKLSHYRQGDVLVQRVQALPAKASEVVQSGRVVLAHGEVTGHAHAIAPGQATEFNLDLQRFLSIADGAEVKHEEHSTVELPAGVYEIIQQSEYSPQEIRNVAD